MNHPWANYPHVLDTRQFKDSATRYEIFQLANYMRRSLEKEEMLNTAKGKVMISLFYEPSTRTRFSFETAMQLLSGMVVSTENAKEFSSAAKGESLRDSSRVSSGYGGYGKCKGVIVQRHPVRGAAEEAAKYSKLPVVNAGDADHQHPTQAILDEFTINDEIGRLGGLKIGFVGDNKKSRTVNSLAYLFAQHGENDNDNELFFISHDAFKPNASLTSYLDEKGVRHYITNKFDDVLPNLDVLYVTRLQIERYFSKYQNLDSGKKAILDKIRDKEPNIYYEKFAEIVELDAGEKAQLHELVTAYKSFIITNEVANRMKKEAIIMHPLPRVDEIAAEVDDNPRARYFEQSDNGVIVRMALLKCIFDYGKGEYNIATV